MEKLFILLRLSDAVLKDFSSSIKFKRFSHLYLKSY